MKHLKLFEDNSLPVKMTKVDFTGGDDGGIALYINDILVKDGDYYHDKIDTYIKGFVDGARWCGLNVIFETVYCTNEEWIEEVSQLGNPAPKNLSDIYKSPKAQQTNELFGINGVLRSIKYEDELEGKEIKILLTTNQISDLQYSDRKEGKKFIKSYTFKIDSHKSGIEYDTIKIEMLNWLHPVVTPGGTDYLLYHNDKLLKCSLPLCKHIWNKAHQLY